MKKFIYSMENIFQIKQKLEDQMKIAYGNARLNLTKEEEKLDQMMLKKVSYEEELRFLRSAKLDLIKIKHSEQAIDFIKSNIKIQITAVKNATQRLEVARIRLSNAMVERKTQEKLKENALEDYMLIFDAEERKEVDELNSFQYSNPTLDEEDR